MFRAFTAASILALTVTTAQGAPATDVKFSDLDLSNPSDAGILQSRVLQASDRACGALLQSGPPKLFYQDWYRNCVHATRVDTTRWVEARAGQYRAFASK